MNENDLKMGENFDTLKRTFRSHEYKREKNRRRQTKIKDKCGFFSWAIPSKIFPTAYNLTLINDSIIPLLNHYTI